MAAQQKRPASKVMSVALTYGLGVGIVIGSVLGIPPFIAFVDSILGGNLANWSEITAGKVMVASLVKYLVMAAACYGAFRVWQSPLLLPPKVLMMFGLGVVFVNLFPVPGEEIIRSFFGSIVLVVGVMLWALINANQIYVLVLKQEATTLKKLVSSVGPDAEPDLNGATPTQAAILTRLSKNRTREALNFFAVGAIVCYGIEIAVNLFFGGGTNIDWSAALRPGGLVSMVWNLFWFAIQLGMAVASIETCVISLFNLHRLESVIRS
jgi:hypothetical protein